ncbi:hypothetical protein NIES4071_67560 [Calothrix sp. NIES-4071]|nr:hypothetical protein NIES4071_67560 [Calothrix sp. NIES-4071]BAZ61034.1 hypothetical protein NIES4105_67520 [Calothrix sp. NIES-4105]
MSELLVSKNYAHQSDWAAQTAIKTYGIDGSLSNAQDTDLWFRSATVGDFVAVKKVQVL